MRWLKQSSPEGPVEIVKLPVFYTHLYHYDLARMGPGDHASWVLEATIEQNGVEETHKFRLVMEVR